MTAVFILRNLGREGSTQVAPRNTLKMHRHNNTPCHIWIRRHNGFPSIQKAETLAKCLEYIRDHLLCFWAHAGLLQKKVREIQREISRKWLKMDSNLKISLCISLTFFRSSPAGAQKHTKWSQMYSKHLAKVSAFWIYENPLYGPSTIWQGVKIRLFRSFFAACPVYTFLS